MNPNRKQHPGNKGHTVGYVSWNKNKTAKDDPRIQQGVETRKTSFKEGKWTQNPHHWTDDEKEAMRNKTIDYIITCKGNMSCRYSKEGCLFIDELNKHFDWNLQHAENGGEFRIAGYYLDGYDSNLNIAFEYDEPKHYSDVFNNVLTQKDINR